MMKNTITMLLLSFIMMSCAAQKKPKIKGDKNVIEINNIIKEAFNKIVIDDGLEVKFIPSQTSFYRLETDANIAVGMNFKVVDSVLQIYSENRIVSSKKLNIEVSAGNIEAITLKNDASIESKRVLESKTMILTAGGSSKFDLDIDSKSVGIVLSGNAGGRLKIKSDSTYINMSDRTDLKGDLVAKEVSISLADNAELKLDGTSDTAKFNVSGGSGLKLDDLKVDSASLNASGNTDVYINVAKELDVYAKDKSSIFIYGEPTMNVSGLVDDAKIEKRG